MKKRNRLSIYLFCLVPLALVVHIIYKVVDIYLEKGRMVDRIYGLVRVVDRMDTLVNVSRSRDSDAFLQGKEPIPSLVWRNEKGDPLYSWRFAQYLTLPDPLPKDLLWTADEYESVRKHIPHSYCLEGNTQSVVFAIGGPDTAFDQINPTPAKLLPHNLILFADVFESNTHWMQPGDFNVENIPEKFNVPGGFGSRDYSGFFVVFVDGQIWHLQDNTPIKLLMKFCTITGAKENSRDLLEPYCDLKHQLDKKNLAWLK
ncbi:hypothetical protein V6x_13900 [Gimesia chilikensis]|uniref:DUF1559 domain-containing protein n=1 Tax=Gimesia chilikensis TaxID=2605989 RepID=A0A517W8Z5_9PLAN|nr:hypothetical protein [Gimesia chilikensis]QDU01708.1 hypothetical protein V6x_13900 [Gimesia chilikensis]